jgi:ATP-binding protein involved in chromosome partitioning
MPMPTKDQVLGALAKVDDPEIHRSIVELGMVRSVVIEGAEVAVEIALTIAGCPLKSYFHEVVPATIQGAFPEVAAVRVELGTMNDDDRAALVGGVRVEVPPIGRAGSRTTVIAIGSGKGGVGKSTVTVNLAAALAQAGHTVGLLDADVWGFSVPRMLGVTKSPTVVDNLIMPVEVHGLKFISIGNFVGEEDPVVWRGPMLHKAIEQFLSDVFWDDREFLLIDMPPGTGDVSISLSQFIPGAAFVLVTTPQEAAERVAYRAGKMAEKVGLKTVGVVENMTGFVCSNCDTVHDVFGSGGGDRLAEALDVQVLGRVPLDPRVRQNADEGVPAVIATPGSPASEAYRDLARALVAVRGSSRKLLPLIAT